MTEDYTTLSVQELTERAAKGDPHAQTVLGCYYGAGEGVEQDIAKANELLALAAAQDFGDAQYHLGVSYYAGRGVDKNLKQALTLLGASANKGNPDAIRDYLCAQIDCLVNYVDHFDEDELQEIYTALRPALTMLEAKHNYRMPEVFKFPGTST